MAEFAFLSGFTVFHNPCTGKNGLLKLHKGIECVKMPPVNTKGSNAHSLSKTFPAF
jgi:hypothetical protein